MRCLEISATAIAVTTMLSGAFAAVAPSSYDAAAAPPAYTSATTTYYTTRTVMRVVETMTATRNGSASVYSTAESSTATTLASATLYPYSNGTTTSAILSTGAATGAAKPTDSSVYTGSASQLSVGMAAFLGLAGLLL